jgi:hypothetical protein
MTRRWLIAAAAILTLGAISLFNAPAMAREEHPRYGHVPAREHPVVWRRSASPREAATHHAAHVWATHTGARHFHAPHPEAYRR